MISLFGTSSILGASIGTHTFNFSGRNKKIYEFPKESNNKFSLTNKKVNKENLIRKVNKENNRSSLSQGHFADWRFHCEGAVEEIYLVTKENKVFKIPAKKYGQKKRRISDGISIDKYNPCFGFRSLIHNQEELKEEIVSNMERVQQFFKLFSTSDEGELKKLGKWWSDLTDLRKCEILEVVAECDKFKQHLGNGKKVSTIEDGLKISLEEIVKLARKKKFKAPKVSDFVGYKKLIYLPSIGSLASLAGGVVDEWSEDYINEKYKDKEAKGGVNGFALVEKLIKGEQAYKTCSKEEKTNFYDECKKEIDFYLLEKRSKFDEELTTPKVVGVVKGGTMEEAQKSFVVSTGTTTNKMSETKKWVNETWEKDPEKVKEYIKSFKSEGRKDGIIDVRCKRFDNSLLIWDDPKKYGCELAWKYIFDGDVDDKRLCLFKIPKGKSYLKEYQLSFVKFSNWWNNDKFWAKCSDLGL